MFPILLTNIITSILGMAFIIAILSPINVLPLHEQKKDKETTDALFIRHVT